MKEISLRPYSGRLFVAFSIEDYERSHKRIFKTPDELTCAQNGRFSGGEGMDGLWTYLVWANSAHAMVHELTHVLLHVFERCGIDPISGNGEPFCYMLESLVRDSAK